MVLGIFLTLLQAISEFFKSLARSKGIILGLDVPELLLLDAHESEKLHSGRPITAELAPA
jgi:hypothetical protein